MYGDEREVDCDYDEDEDEEMSAAERDLASDAQWKLIQKNTFTRWANEHLKTVNKNIADLEGDFSDGLRLLALIEVLSGKQFKRINKRPNFRTQKLENVTRTLEFLENDEGIKIVNIDSGDIVDKNLKLILGLIWTLILHYSISMPMWEGEEQGPSEGGPTPKQRLLNWIQSKVPDLPIKNFTTDWNDGKAIGALVDAVGPGLCPDWEDWDPKKKVPNAKEALDAAEKWLDVPQLIKPDEMTNPKIDEMSMMTYLSQFPNAKLKPGAPVRPRLNTARVRAFGPGIEPKGNQVGAPARFTIETFSAGKGEVIVIVLNPKGKQEPCEVVFNNDRNLTYSCVYVPSMEGEYRIIVKFATKEIPKSPYKVLVEGAAGDPTKVTAKGPGIEKTGVIATKRTYFEVYTKNAGKGQLEVVILDPHGRKDTIRPSIQPLPDKPGTFLIEYTPIVTGLHSVNIFFSGHQIPNSPYGVGVAAPSNAKAVYASGRGIQPRGVRVSDHAVFRVHTKEAGDAEVKVNIIGPGGIPTKCTIKKLPDSVEPGCYECIYIPLKPGNYIINVTFGDQSINRSPFKVEVGIMVQSKIIAFGPGLEGGVVNQPAIFTVETNGETGSLGFSIEGPSQAKIDCKDNGDGSADVTYYPTVAGEYAVHVLCNNEDIPKSPYMVDISPVAPFNASKVAAFGPGLEPGVTVIKWAEFTIDTRKAGAPAPTKVTCLDIDLKPVDVQVKDNRDGTFSCKYMPRRPVKHTITITYGGVQIPNSPFRVIVLEPSSPGKVKVYGPGIEKGVKTNIKTFFTVDCKDAGPGDVGVALVDGQGKDVPLNTIDKQDGTFLVEYEPKTAGEYTASIYFAGQQIPKSPVKVKVEASIDLSKVRVEGLEPKIPVGQPREVAVIDPNPKKSVANIMLTTPKNKKIPLPVKETPKGPVAPFVLEEPGPHKFDVVYAGVPLAGSPFKVEAVPVKEEPMMAQKKAPGQHAAPGKEKPNVKAYGPGLEGGSPMRPAVFTIDTREAKTPGGLGVSVEGPKEAPINCKDNGNGTCEVTYVPEVPGDYLVNVLYADEHIANSPFTAKIVDAPIQEEPMMAQKKAPGQHAAPGKEKPNVKAYGPGLKGGSPKRPATFTVDTREAKTPGGLGVSVEGPKEAPINCKDNGNGTCDVTYVPEVPGEYKVNVLYADEHIAESPFTAKIVETAPDLSGVFAEGPGLSPDGVYLDSPTGFTVNAKSVTPTGDGKVRAIITNPKGVKNDSLVTNNNDGTYNVLYTPYEQGNHEIDVTYDEMEIPKSPFKIQAKPGCDPNRVKAYGPGLEPGNLTNKPAEFTVDIRGAGQGSLGLAVEGPAEAKMTCNDNRDGTCTVQYMPVKPGDYDIAVKFAEQNIPGSPFKVPVKSTVDPSKVKVYGPGVDSKGVRSYQPATFTVDTTEAGDAPLNVSYTDQAGQKKPVELVPISEGLYNAAYVPTNEGKCKVDVNFANQPVPKSPFQTRVLPSHDASKVKVFGPGVENGNPASLPTSFTIDTTEAGIADLEVMIQRPDGSVVRPDIVDNADGTCTVKYCPEDCEGPYAITVNFGGSPVPKSPFKVQAKPVGDPSKCVVKNAPPETVPINKDTFITVDASEAGEGKVTCRIRSPTGSDIDIKICENPDGTFTIQFTPQYPGTYSVNIKFGGQPIPQGDYQVQVGEELISPTLRGVDHSAPPGSGLFHPVEFRLPVGPIFNFVSAYVVMPSGKKAYPKILDNKDGTITMQYQPTETGCHELFVHYNNEPIEGSPFKFHVEAVNTGHVTAYGPGLSHGIVNEPGTFTIVTKEAGAGGLSLAIEGPSKTDIKCNDNGDGTCTVSYVPTAPGEYTTTVKFADKHIAGSPFTAKITPGEPRKRAQISVGSSSEVSLKVTETDIFSLSASIRGPSGREEPCLLKRLDNGHLGISFTPRETGEHLVNVYRNGKHIANSPFTIMVGESEIGNAGKVKVFGKGLKEGMANDVNEFTVDTREAGFGGLSLSIEGPSKADIECHDAEDGTCRVTYKPTEPGTYIINIKFADQHVNGSPFSVTIGGEGLSRQTERITRHREAADVTHIGSQCELSLKIPGTSPFDMTASVTSPSGTTELCDVASLDESRYSIKFVPKEMGVHTVSVKHKDMHIPGSPFEFTVGPITGGGAHKVHASGPGLQRGEVGEPGDFNIYTREAGAGGLSIAVEGPSKAEIDFEDRKDGSCSVNYKVTEPGEYYVTIKYNEEHIPDSPFRVLVSPHTGDAHKLSISALQDKGLQVDRPAAFVVNFNGAKGKLQARVVAPSGAEDEALIQEIDDGEYAVRFIPRENGPHLVHVMFDGCHIPDSPYRILVGKVDADPGRVTAHGEGLVKGRTAQVCKFIVNTMNAGAGALAVTVEGASKVKLECKEVEEGYEFSYTPTAPGDYFIVIRYAGVHIAGSPFKARIEGQGQASSLHEQASVVVETVTKTSTTTRFASIGRFQSDATKVMTDGPGLKKAFRGKTSTFTVDTSQAGNNILYIGMVGPKGPCEELNVKHQGNNVFKVVYMVKESGNYMLIIKWGDDHIGGSPYCVEVN